MIRAVVFDQGKVRCTSANEAIREDISRTLGVDKQIVEELWTELVAGKLGRGEYGEEEFWLEFYARSGATRPLPPGESLLVREMRRLHSLISGVVEIGDELVAKSRKVAILSNTIPPHAKFEKSLGHYGTNLTVVLSCDPDVRARKPERRIYEIILSRLGLSPEQIVIVDDDENYKEAVLSFGIKWLTFKDAVKLRKDLSNLGLL